MASFNTLSSSVMATKPHHPSSSSSQSCFPHLSPSITIPATARFSSTSQPLRSRTSSALGKGAACRRFSGFSCSGLNSANFWMSAALKPKPLKIMISGAPASGKGTQCELIKKKYDLVHIAAGDLLRAEVVAGTENGKLAKEYMEKGMLAPDEIVVAMVKERLLQPDAQENGWLLDGYPRSLSQAKALEDLDIRPDLFILLDVNEDNLVERVVGRRLDPVTGKIYHLKYSPPENEEIAKRLVQRFDDTEERVKLRLKTHHRNVESVLSLYEDIIVKVSTYLTSIIHIVNGDLSKEDVFGEIDRQLSLLLEMRSREDSTFMTVGVAH